MKIAKKKSTTTIVKKTTRKHPPPRFLGQKQDPTKTKRVPLKERVRRGFQETGKRYSHMLNKIQTKQEALTPLKLNNI